MRKTVGRRGKQRTKDHRQKRLETETQRSTQEVKAKQGRGTWYRGHADSKRYLDRGNLRQAVTSSLEGTIYERAKTAKLKLRQEITETGSNIRI